MDITTALKHAMDGNAILFLGAGFSIGGSNKLNQTLPIASELSYQMCDELAIDHSNELALISERFVDDPKIGKGINSLISFLKERLICTSTTSIQDNISNLPWLRIYTTNYDNIFEISSRKLGIEREVITATLPKKDLVNINGAIVHMNGNIINITPEKFYDEFKITNESYLKQGFLSSPWGDQFIADINNCKAVIFVGYSLKYDLELQKIMHDKIHNKAIFIDRKDTDGNQAYLFSKWGDFYPIEAKGLSDEILKVKANYTPEIKEQKLIGLKELLISNYSNSRITPNDVLNLLVYGKYNSYDFRNPTEFYLKRIDILKHTKLILEAKKICLIHSNLGNGKSIVLQYLASQLVEENNVYFLNSINSIQEDLALIKSRKSTSHIIFVDDYDLHLPLFKELSYDFPDNIKIIATSRTSLSSVLIDHLETDYNFSMNEIGVLNIEIISDSERKDLISLLDKYHFWGSNSTLSPSEKNNLINKVYQNRLSSIFYMLLDSHVISDKMNSLFNDLKNSEINKYLLAQSICNISNFKLKGFEIAHLADIDYSEIEKGSLSQNFREIFLRTSDDIELRSTIFAQYIIRTSEHYTLISDLLTKIFTNSLSSFNNEYNIIRKKLISRSNLIEIFGGRKRNSSWKERDQDIYNFYTSIQDYSKNNPFFWLQYGITALNLDFHVDASIYFQNAYSYAEQLENFDSFQLDTHYARFLLSEIADYDETFNFNKFEQAHRLLMDNSNVEIRLSYVLRQVGIYSFIDKKFATSFTAEERFKYISYIKEVVSRFNDYFAAIERKKKDNFYFAVEKPVRGAYKAFHKVLSKTIPNTEICTLDNRYNKLVNKFDQIKKAK